MSGLDVLGRDRASGHQAAAADRSENEVKVRHLFDHLQPDGSLTGDDMVVVVGVNQRVALALDHLFGDSAAIVERLTCQLDIGAIALGLFHLGEGRRLRHHDGCRDLKALGVICGRLGMVAGRHGDHADALLLIVKAAQFDEGAPVLERVCDLEVLVFDIDFRPGKLRELWRGQSGCLDHLAVERFGGTFDIVECYGHWPPRGNGLWALLLVA